MTKEKTRVQRNILLSRLLTRSGDQAWDFALPLALIIIFPQNISLGIGLYFLYKLLYAVTAPVVGERLDEWSAKKILQHGIGLQTLAVLSGGALIWWLYSQNQAEAVDVSPTSIVFLGWFVALTVSMLLGSLGAMIMDIFITQVLVPDLFKNNLTKINAYIRQIDLGTEVASPVIVGILLTACASIHPLAGFSIVVLWNALSFLPEYVLVYTSCKNINAKSQNIPKPMSILQKYRYGFRAFFNHRLTIPLLAYTMLWFSALSPHGVLLTTFLKGGWQIPEQDIGLFRGLGAVFGVSSTILFPYLVKKLKLLGAAGSMILLQAVSVLIATAAFMQSSSHWYFFGAILVSRIGLYGFMQGEIELRQRWCTPGEKGQISSFASAINNSATLLLLLAGSIFTNPEDFAILVIGSTCFVCIGAGMYFTWAWIHRHESMPGDGSAAS